MSYRDAHQARSAKPIIAVAALHVVIAYGFISGLAYQVIPFVDPPMTVRQIDDDRLPPPKTLPQPPQPAQRTPLTAPDTVIQRPDLGGDVIMVPTLDPNAKSVPDPQPLPPPTPPVLHPSQARGAGVIGDRAAWVTADDYPSAALREGVEGTVEIGLAIDAKGRVTACEVTQTSGNIQLDQQTCRIYARRARFTPALDDEGRPTATHRADRVRWQIPAQ